MNTQNTIFFDIETEPLPLDQIKAVFGEFDPESVKLGNLKDPDKIAAKLEERRKSYDADLVEGAAVDPMKAKVLAVGLMYPDDTYTLMEADTLDDERRLLQDFWVVWTRSRVRSMQFAGWAAHKFDLPFLLTRSWWQGVKLPDGFAPCTASGYRTFPGCIDLETEWVGNPRDRLKLDYVSRFLGLSGKRMAGKDFWKYWREGGDKKEEALAYLENDDVRSLKVIAERI